MKIRNNDAAPGSPRETGRRFTTLFLDVDGTLLNFDEAERRGVRTVMRSQGVEPTKALVLRYHEINDQHWKAFERGDIAKEDIFRLRFPAFFRTVGVEIDAPAVERLYRSQLDSCAVLMDGALEICTYLKDRGYHLYVVTNGVAETQRKRLGASGLAPFFEDLFISEEIGSQKPQKEYFDYCFARVPEKDPAKMMIIGDSMTSDIRGGINAGIATCLADFGGTRRMAGIRPDYEVSRLADLAKIL